MGLQDEEENKRKSHQVWEVDVLRQPITDPEAMKVKESPLPHPELEREARINKKTDLLCTLDNSHQSSLPHEVGGND